MVNKLSYSQVSKYTMCGESYRLHYKERIRPSVTTGALLFGSALDQALNCLLLGQGNAEETFEKHFTNAKVLETIEYIPYSPNVVYSNSDFDNDLLHETDKSLLQDMCGETAWETRYDSLKTKKSKSGLGSFTESEKVFYGYANWLSMLRKGFLMIDAYRKEVIPKLGKVHEVQKTVSLSNGDDSIIGYIDFVADYNGKKVIFDNKTATFPYEPDSVLTSPQLSLYVHAEGSTRYGGYIVLQKLIKKNRVKVCGKCGHDGSGGRHKTCDKEIEGKRCGGAWIETINPEVNIQIIVDEIPERTEQIVIENMDKANEGIKSGNFTRNFNMCDNFYGGSCPYKGLCFKSKMEGLTKL